MVGEGDINPAVPMFEVETTLPQVSTRRVTELAAEIRAQIIQVRNLGAAVLLVSEDLDELSELSDRMLVMFSGRIVYETPAAAADRATLGRYMVGH